MTDTTNSSAEDTREHNTNPTGRSGTTAATATATAATANANANANANTERYWDLHPAVSS